MYSPRDSITVRVVDGCASCPHSGLDLSLEEYQAAAGSLDSRIV